MALFPRMQLFIRFQAWLLGIWRAIKGESQVDWHKEINEIVGIIDDAIDQEEQRPTTKPRSVVRPNPPAGIAEDAEGKIPDRLFMDAIKRRRARSQLDQFQM